MIRFGTRLTDFCQPVVMGILNVTPDSFAQHCASMDETSVLQSCERLLAEGADIVDVGGCSTRPGSVPVDEQEERRRLDIALKAIRREFPQIIVSVDTSRASLARFAIEAYGADMINDVSGLSDAGMVQVLSRARVPYILTHVGTCTDGLLPFLLSRLDTLHRAGVADVLVDPGLGFGKTLAENYRALHQLPLLRLLNAPVVVGLSRKSMICTPLGVSPDEALNGTTAAHVIALMNGADILRVHDVKQAKETIRIWNNYFN